MNTVSNKIQRSSFLVLVAVIAAVLWAYWPGWLQLWDTWQSDPDYNHGFLVIPISLWLLWQRREQLSEITAQPSWWGIGLIGLSVVFRLLGAEFFYSEFDTWSIPIWVAGVVLLFGGWQLLRWSSGAIAFLWFMTPLPGTLTMALSLPLQKVSALLSTWTLHMFTQPAVRQGTTIILGSEILEVERACSGLRICYGILALAVAYVILTRPGLWRSLFLIAVAIPVAIVANSVRVTITGLLYMLASGEVAQKFSHDFAGLIMLPLAVMILWSVHQTLEIFIAAFQRSANAGVALVLKSAVALIVIGIGVIFWQRKQSDAAVVTLLEVAERFEAEEQWGQAATFLDRYCRIRPDEAEPAKKLAHAAEKLANSPGGQVRAARFYERAWNLSPEEPQLGLSQARLAMGGRQFTLAISAADKLLEQSDISDELKLQAYRIKVDAMLNDAPQVNPSVTWTQIAQVLKDGIERQWDPVDTSYRLAVIYREKSVDGLVHNEREPLAEQVLQDLIEKHGASPLAWLARYNFRRQNTRTGSEKDVEQDLDKAIELALLNIDSDDGSTPQGSSDVRDNKAAPASAEGGVGRQAAPAVSSENVHTPIFTLHGLWLTAAERSFEQKDYAQARTFYKYAQAENPRHFRAYLQLARIATMPGSDADSRESVDDSPSPQSVSPEQRQQAIAILKNALQVPELNDELLLNLTYVEQLLLSENTANVSEAQKQIRELRSRFRELPVEVAVPLHLTLTLVESDVYARGKNFSRAADTLELMLNSKDIAESGFGGELLSKAWMTLAGYYEQQGTTPGASEKAQQCYQTAATVSPGSADVKLYEAFTQERANNPSNAADLYEEVALRLGNQPTPWVSLARTELQDQLRRASTERDFTRFRNALAQAKVSLAPVEQTAILEAEYLVADGNPGRAVVVLQDALQRLPKSVDLWRSLTIAMQITGNQAGVQQAVQKLDELVENPFSMAILRAELLSRNGDLEGSRRLLSEILETTTEQQQRRQLNRLIAAAAEMQGKPDEALAQLKQFLVQHPDDVPSLLDLSEFYWRAGSLDELPPIEQQLQSLEGTDGPLWKELRARRLIRMATATDLIDSDRVQMLQEARQLATQLRQQKFNPQAVEVLLGRLAASDRKYQEAAKHFEKAWELGDRSIVNGTELIAMLSAANDSQAVNRYLEQMQTMVASSPLLFDAAMMSGRGSSLGNAGQATQIAKRWTEAVGDASSFVRLARTIVLAGATGPLTPEQLDQAEQAFRRAIELDAANPQTWGEYFRFLARQRNDSSRSLRELNEFVKSDATTELERHFVAAQILSVLELQSAAARAWHRTAALAEQVDNAETSGRVLQMAAVFFASVDQSAAQKFARRSFEAAPENQAIIRILISLLGNQSTTDSLNEAVQLSDKLRKDGKLTIDSDRRLVASILLRRALQSFEAADSAKADLANARQLMESLESSLDNDIVLMARITGAEGDKQSAFLALSDQARRTNASPGDMRICVEFWQDEVNDPTFFPERVQDVLTRLRRTPGAELLSLTLQLRPTELTEMEAGQITLDFLKQVVAGIRDTARRSELLQQVFLTLANGGRWSTIVQLVQEETPIISRSDKLIAALTAGIFIAGTTESQEELRPLIESISLTGGNLTEIRIAADYCFMKGLWTEAEGFYQRCMQLAEQDPGPPNNLALVVVELRQDHQQAQMLIDRALSLAQATGADDSSFQDTKAQLMMSAGNLQSAYELLTQLSSSLTADTSVFLHLAECCRQLGYTDQSKESFEIFQQMRPNLSLLPPMERQMYQSLTSVFGTRLIEQQAKTEARVSE